MGFKKNNPGCNCCEGCTICSGNCGWTAETGSIDEVSFAPDLLVDGSDTIATCDTDASVGTVAVRASVTVAADSGDVCKLGIKYVDASNYWYVEMTPGTAGTLKLYERSGGSSTQRGPTMPIALAGDSTYGLTICYGGGVVRAAESVSGIAIAYATTTTSTSGLSAFVGTGTIAGAPLFSSFLYEYGYYASGHSTCTECCSTGCSIASTAFPGGDSTDIGYGVAAGFEEKTGSWDITSNRMRCTSPGVALFNTLTPCARTEMIVSATIRHDNNTGSCDLIVCANSETDYFYVRYNFVPASIEIKRNNGGSHSTLKTVSSGVTLAVNTDYTAKACVDQDGSITAYLGGTAMGTAFSQPVTGIRAGLSASGSGTATFDDFALAYSASDLNPACDECAPVRTTCSECCVATQSGITFTVEWPTSFTHISGACSGFCERLAAGDYSLSFTSTCKWSYVWITPDCANGCSDGQSYDPGDISCDRGRIVLEIIQDDTATPKQCYLRLTVTVNNAGNSVSPDQQFIAASYMSPIDSPDDFCSGGDFTLAIVTSITSTSDTYRGTTGWYPDYSGGCNESLPSSVVVHA